MDGQARQDGRKQWPGDYMKGDTPDGIECPKCGCKMSSVRDTRKIGRVVKRVRICRNCGHSYFTFETT